MRFILTARISEGDSMFVPDGNCNPKPPEVKSSHPHDTYEDPKESPVADKMSDESRSGRAGNGWPHPDD